MGLGALGGCNDQKPASRPDAARGQAEADNTAADVAEADAKEKEALEAYVEAVVYGLPLVIMDITKDKTTNVTKPEDFAAPISQFVNVRAFPDASFKGVMRANVDTLYSSAFLDLSAEPIVLSVPDTHGRYYLMPMLDAWTNVFASPGKRSSSTGKRGRISSVLLFNEIGRTTGRFHINRLRRPNLNRLLTMRCVNG
jgi:hypothetical protein